MESWDRVVYKMISRINGEYYIGKCTISDEYRDKPTLQILEYYQHILSKAISKKEATLFQKKILDIGLENFDFIILDYCCYDRRYDKKNIFEKYLSKETNLDLLLYQEQYDYVKRIICKGE